MGATSGVVVETLSVWGSKQEQEKKAPKALEIEAQYHELEAGHVLNIHDGTQDKIFIDNKETLSELNKWKFNALKLDYLVREVIRFGGKDNDTLSMILDLHEDIQLDEVSETAIKLQEEL